MKMIVSRLVIITCICCLHNAVSAQNPSADEVQKHDLLWIKSANDFDQSKFSEAQVNLEIAGIIGRAAADNVMTKDIEVPINGKTLKYIGYVHPNDGGLFNANRVSDQNSASINKKLYTYKYDNFYISTETDDAISQQNVYYAIRTINILRYRYTQAYRKLFKETGEYRTDRPQFGNFSNANKAFWIAFNESPDYIAVSYTSFLGDGFFPDSDSIRVDKYKNIPVVSIHSKNIMGDIDTRGSKPIYRQADPKDNYTWYMKEGLLESIVHEMLHRYIDYAYSFDKTISGIRNSRNLVNFSFAEECAVMNTSLTYFTRMGGLSVNLFNYYYTTVFNPNIQLLKTNNVLEAYGKKFTDTIADKKPRQIFRFDLLD